MFHSRPSRSALLAALAVAAAGCRESRADMPDAAPGTLAGAVSAAPVCEIDGTVVPLPDEVRETSGLAWSRLEPDLFWTHNDAGNDPVLFGVDPAGRLVRSVRVSGADLEDWEDIEAASCSTGACLYVADIGDNAARRETLTVYLLPEPRSADASITPIATLQATLPDGAQDAEAMFVLPGGDLYVVTKGRHGPIGLYRLSAPVGATTGTTRLERVDQLFAEPRDEADRITGAAASPNGDWVALRSYRTLYLYPAGDLVDGGGASPTAVDLTPLGEAQGEGVAIGPDGEIRLSSEAENRDARPQLSRLVCTLPPA